MHPPRGFVGMAENRAVLVRQYFRSQRQEQRKRLNWGVLPPVSVPG